MRSLLIILTSLLCSWNLSVSAQTSDPRPPVSKNLPLSAEAVLIKDRERVASIQMRTLGQSLLNIYRSTGADDYFFIPFAQVNWSKFSHDAKSLCASKDKAARAAIGMNVRLHSPALMEEIKRRLARQLNKPIEQIGLSTPSNIGFAIFAIDSNKDAHEILVTVPFDRLLRGASISNTTAGSVPILPGRMNATCSEIYDVAEQRNLSALMFVVGSETKVNQLALAAHLTKAQGLLSNLKNDESKIDRTTTRNSKRGGSIAIKIGGSLGGSGGNQTATATVDREQQRIVNRAWFDDAFDSSGIKASIDQTCETGDCAASISDRLFSIFFDEYKQQVIRLEKLADQRYQAWAGATKIDVGKISISEELKSALNSASGLEEKASGNYEGIKVTKEDKSTFKTDSDVSWRKSGDDWIPTSMSAYIVGSSELERKIDFKFRQTIVGDSLNAAIALQVIELDDSSVAPDTGLRDDINKSLSNPAAMLSYFERKRHILGPDKRQVEIEYLNDRNYPIEIQIRVVPEANRGCEGELWVDGIRVSQSLKLLGRNPATDCILDATIPAQSRYRALMIQGAFGDWIEWF